MKMIHEPARDVPVVHECDVCVIGGSTTGVFAAVAAARLGARVALVEALGLFGGTATASLVCVWHSHLDTTFTKPIIGGLPVEAMERLVKRDAVVKTPGNQNTGYIFSPYELAIELDEMIAEAKVRPFLHTRFVAPVGNVDAVVIEDKTGRRAIKARMFVDASGDGDLAHRAGFPTYIAPMLQPPTSCCILQNAPPQGEVRKQVFAPGGLRPGFLWAAEVPGTGLDMFAGTRVHGANCADADELTRAEIEGRRQVRQMLDIVRRQAPSVRLVGLPARIGVRQSRQVRCLHQLTERDVLTGVRFPDAIANGSYRVDVHAGDGDGLIFRYLDGREETVYADGRSEKGRWCENGTATFYQMPYRSLVPVGSKNVLVAGRCLDADEGAFGAVRVMVNCAQLGHAAGVAAWLALDSGKGVAEVDTGKVRRLLAGQGAVIFDE